MRAWTIAATAAVAAGLAGLAGCYTAEMPLLTEANSVAPYAKITFREEASKDVSTLTRTGNAYTIPAEDGTGVLTLRFMATDRPDWYVVQVHSPPGPSGLDLLYAVLRVDLAKRQAQSFRALADLKNAGAGTHLCNDIVCIDDIKAYANAAIAYAEMGGPPDTTYAITVE
jgi:hypothetical protein